MWRTLAALLALSLVAAACGGDDDESGADGSDDTAATAADAEEVLGAPNAASGEPVKVGFITEGGSETIGSQAALAETGAEIAVEYANEYLGGIGGRPIELFVCGNQATPAGAQDCGNQMIEQGVVAVTLPFTGFGEAQAPVITGAGIPYVTGSGNSAAELTAPGAFALTGGYPGMLGAFAQHASDEGVEKFAMVVIDVPSATQAAEQLGGMVFGNAGVEFEVITAAPGTPDLTPQLQSAVDGGADAIGVTGDVTFCTSFLQAYQTLAIDVPKYVIATCVDPTVIDSLGDTLAGSFIATNATGDSDDADLYAAMLTTYAPDEDIDPDPILSAGVTAGASSVIHLVRAMEGLEGDVSAETVLAQMQAAQDVPLWLGDGQTFTCDGSAVSLMPNVCSTGFFIGTLNADGEVEDPAPVDATALFEM
ncbi:MAG: ABC transporter substrate-binding protein [Acidimicrobiales bacterium]|nr:ABC transporter substrate-binding protein [Acidimicrobiales bacterium]